MELSKPFASKLLIITLIFLLILGVTSLFTNILLDKQNVKRIITNQGLEKIIKEDKKIIKLLDKKKIPKEVLDNVNINSYIDKGIDRLYNQEYVLIKNSEITTIIKNSIYEYEKSKNVDIYSNIKTEIKDISINISKNINNKEYINSFNMIRTISGSSYIIMIISILPIVLIIINEKSKGLLIDGLSILLSTFASYYLMSNASIDIITGTKVIDVSNELLLETINNISKTICGILFTIGIVFIIMYIVFNYKRLLREFRLKYVYK